MDEIRKAFEAFCKANYIRQVESISYLAAFQAGRAAGFAEAREAAVKVCKDSAGYDGGIRKALDEILALEPK